MRTLAISLALTFGTAAIVAQQPGKQLPAPKTFASAADVAALAAKAKADRKEGQAIVSSPILSLAPYNANLEYRASAGAAAVHEKEAEFFYVIEGAGTIVTGGKLVGETRTNAENLSGTAIEGGTTRNIAKGDFLVVPENTPHQITAVVGAVTLMTLHAPRPVPSGK